MMKEKKVEYFKNQEKTSEKVAGCNRLVTASASEYVVPIYYDCLKEIFDYQKKPVLFSQHLLFLDDRLKKGLEIYRNKKITSMIRTNVDIFATVSSRTEKDKEYDVVLKTWLPEKMPRHRHEIIEYLENLTVSCSCKDFIMNGKYRNNCSIICPHIAAVLWFLIQEDSMPKFLRTQEEYQKGYYENSKTVELDNEIYGVPMKMFDTFLNILALREFKEIKTSVSLSVHRKPKEEYKDRYPEGIKPVWITFAETEDVERVIKALVKGYVEMLASRQNTAEDIMEAVRNLVPQEEKKEEVVEEKPKEEIKKLNLWQKMIKWMKKNFR